MFHIIDGYNLLFFLDIKSKTLRDARQQILDYVSRSMGARKGVCVVFDGKQEKGLGFSRIKYGPIEVIYTIDGMSADDYIVEWFQQNKLTSTVCVYTNDQGLKRNLSDFPAKVIDLRIFKQSIEDDEPFEAKLSVSDPRYEKYLLEVFTKRKG